MTDRQLNNRISVTGEPLSDIQFFVTGSDGSVVGNSNGYFKMCFTYCNIGY